MKKHIEVLIFILLITQLKAVSQDIDNTFFILGMKSEYNPKAKIENNLIEIFSVKDTFCFNKFSQVLQNLKNEKFKSQKIQIDTIHSTLILLKNSIISEYIDSFYSKKEYYNYFSEKSYLYFIDKNKFDSKKKIYSYLAGVYSRYGSKDSIYYSLKFPFLNQKTDEIIYLLNKYVGGYIEYKRCFSCLPNIVKINFSLYCDDILYNDFSIDKNLQIETLLFSNYLKNSKLP